MTIVLYINGRGKCSFHNSRSMTSTLGKDKTFFLWKNINQTLKIIRKDLPDLYASLTGRKIHLRISDAFEDTIYLTPHELVLNGHLLDFKDKPNQDRERMLIGEFERVLFHLCNPHLHISQVRIHSLHFYALHRDILKSTVRELNSHSHIFRTSEWLWVLGEIDNIILLERFWTWLGNRKTAKTILKVSLDPRTKPKSKIRAIVSKDVDTFAKESHIDLEPAKKTIMGFKNIYLESGSVVIVYKLAGRITKAVRLCPTAKLDAMSTEAACTSVYYKNVRTDIFHDHGKFITAWIERLKAYSKDPSLSSIVERLVSDDLHKVNTAIDELCDKIHRKESARESMRLLYAALYYWHNPDKGICRSVCLRVNKLLEDILTERPYTFPPSRVNHSVFRGEHAYIRTTIVKPHRISRDRVAARVVWSLNGHRKKPIPMKLDPKQSHYDNISFKTDLPARNGWIHFSVQISFDGGQSWKYEKSNEYSHGLIKYVADERGQRVLSFYADTFNLRLDDNMRPVQDETGTYVYGTFDDITEQLEAIRAEGYMRIYPLGALELGWAGEAGPDPSVFSIWDGKTVRADMGGIEALLRLKEKADSLGMKVLLDVASHLSRANNNYDYNMPVYIFGSNGKLTRRSGWDGEWDEWFDSFMVNMRDYNNVEHLANIYKELAGLGFGLRVDVGHAFDTIFPIDQRISSSARLFGEVVTSGFERIDLRGTWESCAPILKICYEVQKAMPTALIVYSEQWHGNEARMIKSGTIPYNPIIKNLESVRDGQDVNGTLGLNDTIAYLNRVYGDCDGQTLSFFNTHDEESPPSNYQNMIWPAAA
ncbi:MAG: hypothetical protein ACFFCW_44985, partial [Candidatus Hodarchaeota archaeon]